jgi:hypothetical protein
MTNKHTFKVGDLVRIKDNAKEIMKNHGYTVFNSGMEAMVGQVCEVYGRRKYIEDMYYVYTSGKSDFHMFLAEALEPVEDNNSEKPNSSTGFDPENLTFDGVEIKSGDKVKVKGYINKYKVAVEGHHLVVDFGPEDEVSYFVLKALNITAHYPAKNKELERLEEELIEATKTILKDGCLNHSYLDDYYQARKALEEYLSQKSKD